MENKLALVLDNYIEDRIPGGVLCGRNGDIVYLKTGHTGKWFGVYESIYAIEGLSLYAGLKMGCSEVEVVDFRDEAVYNRYKNVRECIEDMVVNYVELYKLYGCDETKCNEDIEKAMKYIVGIEGINGNFICVEGIGIEYSGLLDAVKYEWIIRPGSSLGNEVIKEREKIIVDSFDVVVYISRNYFELFKIEGEKIESIVQLTGKYDGTYHGNSGNSYWLDGLVVYYTDRAEVIYPIARNLSNIISRGYDDMYDIHYVLYIAEAGDTRCCLYNSEISYDFEIDKEKIDLCLNRLYYKAGNYYIDIVKLPWKNGLERLDVYIMRVKDGSRGRQTYGNGIIDKYISDKVEIIKDIKDAYGNKVYELKVEK